jgi:6-phosphogluconate dehydrogenase
MKNKRYKYKDELGSKKIQQHSPTTALESLLVFLNVYRKNLQAYRITVVAFTRRYLGYHIFHREERYFF